jgi:hypothetical protein
MNNNKRVGTEQYADLLQRLGATLNLSFSEVKDRYHGHPVCLMEYVEKDFEDKSIEVQFDEERFTINCVFGEEGRCNSIYLFPDDNDATEEFIGYLKETYDYDFIENRWPVSDHYVAIQKMNRFSTELYFYIFS